MGVRAKGMGGPAGPTLMKDRGFPEAAGPGQEGLRTKGRPERRRAPLPRGQGAGPRRPSLP